MRGFISLWLVFVVLIGVFITIDTGFDMLSYNAEGATLYVGGTGGGNYSNIQSAVDDAISGDTVFVYSGEYEEGVVIDKTITLTGEGRSTTIINTTGKTFGVHIKDTSYVNLSGFAIKGANSVNVKITSSNNNHIFNNFVTDSGSLGIGVSPGSDNLIELNDIRNNLKGIDISGASSHGNIIRDNALESIGDRAISLQQDAFDNVVENNTILNSNVGLYVYESNGNIVKDCEISGGGEGLRIIDVSDIEIESNIFSNNDIAVKILDNANITLSNCTIESSQTTDLLLGDAIYGNAHVILINTTFDESKIEILDPETTLAAFWFFAALVVDKDSNPQQGFSVRLMDNANGTYNETFSTDSQGSIGRITLQEFSMSQSETVNYDPYNITAFNTTHSGYTHSEVSSDGILEIDIIISPNIVEVENHPPEITVVEPVSLTPTIKEGNSLLFTIDDSDPDAQDVLVITWFVNEELVQSGGDSYTFMADFMSAGNHSIKVVVGDGELSTEQIWTLTVKDVIEVKEEHTGINYGQITIIFIIIAIIFTIFFIFRYKKAGKKQVPFDPEDEKK
jgi:parallel beta-helix repeat protein